MTSLDASGDVWTYRKVLLFCYAFFQASRLAIAYALDVSGFWATAAAELINLAFFVLVLTLPKDRRGAPGRIDPVVGLMWSFFLVAGLSLASSDELTRNPGFLLVAYLGDILLAAAITFLAARTYNSYDAIMQIAKGSLAGFTGVSAYVLGTSDLSGLDVVMHYRATASGIVALSHWNDFAFQAGVAVIVGYALLAIEKGRFARAALLGVVTLNMAVIVVAISKTVLLALLVSFVVHLAITRRVAALVGLAVVLAAVSLVWWNELNLFISVYLGGRGDYSVATLSGRTAIWDVLLHDLEHGNVWRLLFGYGYNAFRSYSEFRLGQFVYSAHNEVLNVLWSVGMVGAVLLFSIYFRVIHKSAWALFSGSTASPLALSAARFVNLYFIFLLLRGSGEVSVGLSQFSFWLFLALAALYCRRSEGLQ